MKKFILIGLALLSLCFCSCKKEKDTIIYLYRYSYINFSGLPDHSGWIIDQTGNVKSYNNPEKWNFADTSGYISKQQLSDNISACLTVLSSVSTIELAKYDALIEAASKGELTTPDCPGADRGSYTYQCYWYDKTKGKYKEVLLSNDGDCSYHNTDKSAIEIDSWLKTIKK